MKRLRSDRLSHLAYGQTFPSDLPAVPPAKRIRVKPKTTPAIRVKVPASHDKLKAFLLQYGTTGATLMIDKLAQECRDNDMREAAIKMSGQLNDALIEVSKEIGAAARTK